IQSAARQIRRGNRFGGNRRQASEKNGKSDAGGGKKSRAFAQFCFGRFESRGNAGSKFRGCRRYGDIQKNRQIRRRRQDLHVGFFQSKNLHRGTRRVRSENQPGKTERTKPENRDRKSDREGNGGSEGGVVMELIGF